jgi:hypothetical protein
VVFYRWRIQERTGKQENIEDTKKVIIIRTSKDNGQKKRDNKLSQKY